MKKLLMTALVLALVGFGCFRAGKRVADRWYFTHAILLPDYPGPTYSGRGEWNPEGDWFLLNEPGGMVCSLSTTGKTTLGMGHTWEECATKVMQSYVVGAPKRR
jgi:hypothetical protein